MFASSALPQGLIVEDVAKFSEAEKAGLRTGDVLLTWSRGQESGQINSTFDLNEIENEQAPRGEVTIRGQRESQEHVWVLGQSAWNLTARPSLAPDLLQVYQKGWELLKAGKPADAVEQWQGLASRVSAIEKCWLFSRIASTQTNAQNWPGAVEAYKTALHHAIGCRTDSPGAAAAKPR